MAVHGSAHFTHHILSSFFINMLLTCQITSL